MQLEYAEKEDSYLRSKEVKHKNSCKKEIYITARRAQ